MKCALIHNSTPNQHTRALEQTGNTHEIHQILDRNNYCKDCGTHSVYALNMPGIHINPLKYHTGFTLDQLWKHEENIWKAPGTYLEYTWIHLNSTLEQPGKHLENTWNIPGIHMNPPKFHPGMTWKTHGKHLEHTWNPPKFHPGTTWKTSGKHLEHIWNPLKFHPDSMLDKFQCWSGTHLELTWNEHGLLGFQVESNSVCGIYLDSMELPWTMWNQCGFHEERWGSVNCCFLLENEKAKSLDHAWTTEYSIPEQ